MNNKSIHKRMIQLTMSTDSNYFVSFCLPLSCILVCANRFWACFSNIFLEGFQFLDLYLFIFAKFYSLLVLYNVKVIIYVNKKIQYSEEYFFYALKVINLNSMKIFSIVLLERILVNHGV